MFGIPDNEIKQTLSNADRTLANTDRVLANADRVMAQFEGVAIELRAGVRILNMILSDIQAVTADFRDRLTAREIPK